MMKPHQRPPNAGDSSNRGDGIRQPENAPLRTLPAHRRDSVNQVAAPHNNNVRPPIPPSLLPFIQPAQLSLSLSLAQTLNQRLSLSQMIAHNTPNILNHNFAVPPVAFPPAFGPNFLNHNFAVSPVAFPPVLGPLPTGTPAAAFCRIIYDDHDELNISPYQCLVRQQIELFQATQQDLQNKSQGRNRPIVLQQLGIRCKHCGGKPAGQRAKGAIFFPSQLVTLYQTAQNMANKHLLQDCLEIPRSVREDLVRVRMIENGAKTRKSAYGGGRHYWADRLRIVGVVETSDRRLFLLPFGFS